MLPPQPTRSEITATETSERIHLLVNTNRLPIYSIIASIPTEYAHKQINSSQSLARPPQKYSLNLSLSKGVTNCDGSCCKAHFCRQEGDRHYAAASWREATGAIV